jgi:hypothetical protein
MDAGIKEPTDLTLPEAAARWGVASRYIEVRAAALGVELRRESSTRTVWPAEYVALGDQLAEHLKQPGATLSGFHRPANAAPGNGVNLAELMKVLPVHRNFVFRLVKALGIAKTRKPALDRRDYALWISAPDADRLAEAAQRVARREVHIDDLINDLAGGLVSQRALQASSQQSARACSSCRYFSEPDETCRACPPAIGPQRWAPTARDDWCGMHSVQLAEIF